jgi:preprotein translocase subunit SecY
MFRRLLLVFTDKELRNKFFAIIGLLVAVRFLTHVPIPVLNSESITTLIDSDAVFALLNAISGGGYGRLSFVMLGIGPFVTASIVMQLLTVIVPKLNEMQKEDGEIGRQKINRYTRFLTIPLAALNGWGILQYLASDTSGSGITLPTQLTTGDFATTFPYWFVVIFSMVAGSVVVMWIGEIITEFKMGNGTSLLVLSGIVARVPDQLSKFVSETFPNLQDAFNRLSKNPNKVFNLEVWKAFFFDNPTWAPARTMLSLLAISIFALALVVFFNDAFRKLIVIYSKRGHIEGKSRSLSSIQADLPIKVNMAQVIPIIFAISFILFPSILSRFFLTSNTGPLRDAAKNVESYLSTQNKQTPPPVNTADLPKQKFGNFYLTGSKNEIDAAKGFDITEGQELFAFTVSTKKDVQSSFFEGTPLNDIKFGDFYVLRPNGNNFGFLPEFVLRWNGVLAYIFYYGLLIIFFTFFYTSTIAFKTDEISENMQKSGAYIPGYRPGIETQNYLTYISMRLNIAGAFFLSIIAVLPFFLTQNFQFGDGTLSSIVSGTTLLIMVSTSIETLKQIEAQASIVDYDRFVN